MTSSQKEFDRWMNNPFDAFYAPNDIFNFSSDKKWLLAAWQACNAMWERKLDEGVVTGVIFRAIRDGGGICELDDANGVAQAIIKHIKGE